MKNPKDSFFKGRLRSFKFALKGMWLLMSTEDSIKAQLFVAIIITAFGIYFNTAVEKIADFIHPEYHEKIGFIKDIAAGASSFAAFTSLIIAGFIYISKISLLF